MPKLMKKKVGDTEARERKKANNSCNNNAKNYANKEKIEKSQLLHTAFLSQQTNFPLSFSFCRRFYIHKKFETG